MRRRSNLRTSSSRSDGEWISFSVTSHTGVWEDGWVTGSATFLLEPPANAAKVRMVGYKPDWIPNLLVVADIDGVKVRRQILATGHFVIDLPFHSGVSALHVTTTSEPVFVPSRLWESEEHRPLSWMFVGCEALLG